MCAWPCEALSTSQFRALGKSQRLAIQKLFMSCYCSVAPTSLSHTVLLKSISLFTLKALFHLAASEMEDVLGSRTWPHLILHWNNGCQRGFYKLWKLNIDNIGCRGIRNIALQMNVCCTICSSTYVCINVYIHMWVYRNIYVFAHTYVIATYKWQPTPVFLPGESQGRRSLVGWCLWGRTELDTTEAT